MARRDAGSGLMRRPYARGGGGGGRSPYLTDFRNATVVRASEAPFVDTRINAFAETGWRSNERTWPEAISSWTDVGTPGEVTGIADPFGGTGAVTTTDDDGAAFEGHQNTLSYTLSVGGDYRVIRYVKKDSDTARFPEFQHQLSTSFAHCQINTQTGATAIRAQAGWTNVSFSAETAPEDAGWWKCTLTFTNNIASNLTIRTYPAMSATLGGAGSTAMTGSLTWYPRIELQGQLAWKPSGQLRIFSDDAALIETARTNYITWSSDASQWTKSGTGTVTTGQTAPDGSSAACRISDDDAAAIVSYTQALGSSLGTGAHVYSVFVLKDDDETRFPEFNAFQGSAVISGGAWNVQLNTKTGATTTRAGTPTTVRVEDWGDWWRLEVAFSITTGGTVGTRIYPAATASWGTTQATAQGAITVWNVQVEAGTFASTPIRTSGAQATRAADNVSFAAGSYDAATMATKGWEFDWWPTFASTDTISGGYIVLRHTQATYRYTGATVIRANVSGGTPVELTFGGLSHAKSQKLTGRLNMVTDQATLSGFTAGGGTQSFAGADDNGSSGPLYIGRDSFAAVTLNAVVSRLRRAA